MKTVLFQAIISFTNNDFYAP